MIAPGHAASWASPRAPWILAQSLLRRDTSLRFRLRADPALWRWTLKFLANCTTERNRINTLRKLSLCIYSRDALIELLWPDADLSGARASLSVAVSFLRQHLEPDHEPAVAGKLVGS